MHQGLFWHRCFPRSQLELQRDGHTPVRECRGYAPCWLFGSGVLVCCRTTHRRWSGALGGMALLKNCQGRQVRVIHPACHPSQAKVCAPARGGARQGSHLCTHSLIRSHQPLGADTCLCLTPSPFPGWIRAAPAPRGHFSLQQRHPRAHPHCWALCLCFGLGSGSLLGS